MERPLVKVQIPPARDLRWRSWAKLVEGVDRSKKDGYAFTGRFLQRGRLDELPAGALVLLYDERGSRRYHQPCVTLQQVGGDGSLSPVEDAQGPIEAEGWDWALKMRDRVAAVLEGPPPSPLAQAATEELARELARREGAGEAFITALLAALADGHPPALATAAALIGAADDLRRAVEAARRRLAGQEDPSHGHQA